MREQVLIQQYNPKISNNKKLKRKFRKISQTIESRK